MRTSFLIRSLTLICCWGIALQANASHVIGTELTYEYVGTAAAPNRYHVIVRLFRDISSAVDQPTVDVNCGQNECGNTLPGSFTYTLRRTSSVPMLAGCPGVGSNYNLDTLEGLVTLAPAHWVLSINIPNRQPGVQNVLRSDTQTVFVKAELDNTNGIINSSPRFTSTRVIQLSSTQPQRYNASAFDAEGDSLTYQLVQPLAEPTSTSPCGLLTIGAIAPHFQINAASGELLTVAGPTNQGFYAMAVRVNEYRRISGTWQPIGSITRDMNYLVLTAGFNQLPAFTRVASTNAPGNQLLGQTIRINPGQLLSLALSATDLDASQVLTLGSDAVGVIPGVAFQNQGNGQGLLTWQVPATLPLGRYSLPVRVSDNACPNGVEVLTLSFVVTRQVLATRPRQLLAQQPFPMPFQVEVRFQFAGVGAQSIVIADELGRTVAQLTTAMDGSVIWQPAGHLSAGLYFARNLDGTQIARLAYAGH